MPNPWAIVVALIVWGSSLAGAWFYRGHMDEAAQIAALDTLRLQYDAKVQLAQHQAEVETTQLQTAVGTIADNLNQKLADDRRSYVQQIHAAQAALAAVKPCPVPVDAVRLLVAPAPGGGGAAGADGAAAGAGPGPAGGTVDASAVIASCEANRAAFDRNADRLDACIAAYNAVRLKINGSP